jgi:hypothetical protein
MASKTRYEVVFGSKKSKEFDDLIAAVLFAREKAKEAANGHVVPVWSNGLVIAVVTDDANGLTVFPLDAWPEDVPCCFA